MVKTLDATYQKQIDKLIVEIYKPLEPLEFLDRHLTYTESEPDYWQKASHLLAQAAGVSVNQVNAWGQNYRKRPVYIPQVLRLADIAMQIRLMGACRFDSSPIHEWCYWNYPQNGLYIPDGWRIPRFVWGEQVIITGRSRGRIEGIGRDLGPNCSGGWYYDVKISAGFGVGSIQRASEAQLGTQEEELWA